MRSRHGLKFIARDRAASGVSAELRTTRPLAPQLWIGKHLDIDAADNRPGLKANVARRDGVVPIGHRYTVRSLIEKFENRVHDRFEIVRIRGKCRGPDRPV